MVSLYYILLFVSSCVIVCEGNTFEFKYNETVTNGTEVVASKVVALNGSYARLGDWPHWCLGNLTKCDDGIALDLWIRFASTDINESDILVYTSGGHNLFSNGVYLLQRYGNEYELGVAYLEEVWSVNFRVVSESWVNIHATWDFRFGLEVNVDGASHQTSDASTRDYQQLAFDPFMDIAVGLSMDGSPVTEQSRFEIAKLSVYNWSPPVTLDETGEDLLWLGCGTYVEETTSQVSPETAVRDCRAFCSSTGLAVAVLKGKDTCACAQQSAVQGLSKDASICNETNTWDFYKASSVATQNSDYNITVTVEKLGKKDYVKPLESILIHIQTNFNVEVPFIVDFGDGTFMDVDTNVVSYFWQAEGTYDIEVEANLGIATIKGRTSFTVENVDEGTRGDFVMMHASHGNGSYEANVRFTSIDYADAACDINYGETVNTTDEVLRNLNKYVDIRDLKHGFPVSGDYRMSVNCTNLYGQVFNVTHFTARKLETTYHFHEIGTDFTTNMVGSLAYFNDMNMMHSNKNISIALQHNQSSVTVDSLFLPMQEQYLVYNYKDIVVDKRIVNVQNKVGSPKIFSPEIDGAWNLTTNISVRVPPGNNMFLNISFSSGEDQTFYINHLKAASDIIFEIFFPRLGYYPVMANLSNDISYNTQEVLVSVEVPITNIELKISNIIDKSTPVEFDIDLNDGYRGPMKVKFEIDYGNEFVETYSYYSNTFFFNTYKHKYIYPKWGSYYVCVRAYNHISSITACEDLQVGQKISYIDTFMHSDGRFEVNETASVVIRCPKGSDKTYVVHFGDGETFVFTDTYLTETEEFEDTTTTEMPTTTTASVSTTEAPTTPVSSANNATIANEDSTFAAESSLNATASTTVPTAATTEMKTTTEATRKRRRRDAASDSSATTPTAAGTSTMATDTSKSTSSVTGTVFHQTTASDANTTVSSLSNGNQTDAAYNATVSTEPTTSTTTEIPTTTTAPETTTLYIAPPTMEPLADDAVNPYTTNVSTARHLRDGTVIVTHRFLALGSYTVKVKVFNHFNWKKDTLCPQIIVSENTNITCQPPVLKISNTFASSRQYPLKFFRSDQINLTAEAAMTGCGSAIPTYSWRTMSLIQEDGQWIQRPFHGDGICKLENKEKIFRYSRSSLPFGKYKVVLTVSPSDHPLQTTMHDFFMDVKPSAPYAIIEGNEDDDVQWFLRYGTTMIKFSKSIDPDFDTSDGIEYDLVCLDEKKVDEIKSDTRETLIQKSSLVIETITHKYTSKNPVRLYQYSPCFSSVANITKSARFPKGEFDIPSDMFNEDITYFVIRLFVTKNGLTSSADVTFEIRMSNSTNLLDQLDDLLKSKDTTGVMRAVEALSAGLSITPSNSSEEEDFEAKEQMTELKSKLIGALDSVSEGVKDVEQASGMLGLVDGLTKDASSVSDSARVGATSAIKNSASVTEQFIDEPLDTLTGVGAKVVSGVSNVLPKEDAVAKKLKEHEKDLKQAEKDAKVATAPPEGEEDESEEDPDADGADITLEDEEEATLTELTEEDLASKAPLPYNKLLKKCDLIHSGPLDKLYKYIFFYDSIFRHSIKTHSEEIMITADILKTSRNDMFCYIGVLEEPADVEWYVNRFCDQEKHRRDIIKKNADRDVSKSFMSAIDSVSGTLLNKTESNQTVELGAPGLKVAMKRASANDTGEEDEARGSGPGVKMPAGVLAASGNDSEVGQTLIINDESPFTYSNDSTSVGTGVVTFKLSTPGTKDAIPVSNTTEPIEIYLASKPENVPPVELHTLLVQNGASQSQMNFHKLNLTTNDTTLHIVVRPPEPDSTDIFDVLLQAESYPNDTHYLAMESLPLPEESMSPNLTWEQEDVLRHTFYPDAELTKDAGIYYIGVRLRSGKIDFQSAATNFSYNFQTFTGGCRFWNEENETWSSDGCVVGNLTTYNATQCLCSHLTSFGAQAAVPPNTIDFKNVWAKFNNLNENAAVFSTVVSLLGVYVILLIWARHMDKKDIVKWGASPLEDNLPTDNYHYQLSVSTGTKKGSGTKSNISLIISGETTDTGVRRLFDGKRQTHGTGSIMNYILSVEHALGPLNFCRIWHDNSGQDKNRSWYLEQIECTDLQTGERYFFLCNRWLAVEQDDGMVDRILPVAGIEDLVAFKQLFSSSVRKKLTSDHLWLSVFSRPTRSKFTRVQRISCCMSLLFLTMITNAMWFKSDGEAEGGQKRQVVSLKLGPFSFTLDQIMISLMSTFIVFPPSFLLVTLFRRTKQKKNNVMHTNQRMPKRGKWKNLGNNNSHSVLWETPKVSKFRKFRESLQSILNSKQSKYSPSPEDEEETNALPAPTIVGDPNAKKNAAKRKKKPFMFPAWFSYIAWILCFFSVIVPAFFTILYSMEWGATKANEWLTTFLLSFFQSVIVVQPLKVLCLVAFIACVLKKPDLEEEGECGDELNNAIAAHDEELTAKGPEVIDEIAKRRREANEAFEPPDTEALEESRKNRVKEVKMEAILKEIFVYGFFVLVLFFLSYQQRDGNSFLYTENLKAMLLGKFESITTVLEYWVWLEKIFLPTLYAAKYHNGTALYKWWDKRCISDFETRRMGIARLRQLRIRENSCKVIKDFRTIINHCRTDYNWMDDDTDAYMPAWQATDAKNQSILDSLEDVNPWVYQNSFRLKNAPYFATLQTYKGGGYVINFERSFRRTARNLTRLREENWLDLRTRAVLLEFTTYNPNSNLFASVILTTEFPATGSAVPRSEIKVFRLQNYVGGFAIVVIFFEILYCCFTIFFFVRCIKKVKKEKCKYFKTFWDILEFVMLCFAVSCIAMYAFKHILTEVAFNSLHKQSKAEYINFQSLALYDEMYGYMTAIVVFLASIQFLKLLQFNKKMNMLGETVKVATKDLKVFSIAFLLYFTSFVVTGYLLFGQYMPGYNGFIKSAESCFAFSLGAFDFVAMSGAHKVLGPLFFFMFIAIVYVGLMSIFLTIIADAFTKVKEETMEAENEYEMMDFVWRRFKGIIGVK